MSHDDVLQMAVDDPRPGIRVIRAAGVLTRSSAARLLRLVDAQVQLVADGRSAARNLVVDLADVVRFEPGGMETLHKERHAGAAHGVELALSGCSAHVLMLPLRVRQLLSGFRSYPTVEIAVAELGRPVDDAPPPAMTVEKVHVETRPAPRRRPALPV